MPNTIKPIRTEEEYEAALAEIDALWDGEPECTLRAAIEEANADPDQSLIAIVLDDERQAVFAVGAYLHAPGGPLPAIVHEIPEQLLEDPGRYLAALGSRNIDLMKRLVGPWSPDAGGPLCGQ